MLTAAFKLRGQLGLEEIAVDYGETLELAVATGLPLTTPAIFGLLASSGWT